MSRQDRIREELMSKRSISIIELSETLGVSHVTVRKDIDKLQEEGFLTKSHGIVMLSDKEMQESLSTEMFDIENYTYEYTLAKLGRDLIENGDSIFIGSGIICYLLSKLTLGKSNIRIVTNNFNVVNLYKNSGHQVYFIGGEVVLNEQTQYASGYEEYNFLRGIFVNKAFLSVDGIDSKAGLTVNNFSLVKLYQNIKDIAKEVIVFGTKQNIERIGMYQVGNLRFTDAIIGDSDISDDLKQETYNCNIKLYSNYNL